MSSKQKSKSKQVATAAADRRRKTRVSLLVGAFALVVTTILLLAQKNPSGAQAAKGTGFSTASNAPAPAAIPTMDVNQAVMVTVELDFGPSVPTIAEALREVERR